MIEHITHMLRLVKAALTSAPSSCISRSLSIHLTSGFADILGALTFGFISKKVVYMIWLSCSFDYNLCDRWTRSHVAASSVKGGMITKAIQKLVVRWLGEQLRQAMFDIRDYKLNL